MALYIIFVLSDISSNALMKDGSALKFNGACFVMLAHDTPAQMNIDVMIATSVQLACRGGHVRHYQLP